MQKSIADYTTDQVITATDLQARIQKVLPSRAEFLAGPITVQIADVVRTQLQRFLATPQAAKAWDTINRVGHDQLVSILRGENKYVTINQNDVTLDLIPLVQQALQRIQARLPGTISSRLQIPQISPNATPEQARAQLSAILGRPLPADFGTITLMKGDQAHTAQRAVGIFDKLVVLIIVVTVLLIVAAIVVSPRRWYTVLELALGLLLAVVITKVIINEVTKALINGIKKQGVVPVADTLVNTIVNSLGGYFAWLIAAGVVVGVGAFLATRPRWLAAAGGAVARLIHIAADPSRAHSRPTRWLAAHLDLLRAAGVGVAVVVMLIAPKTWGWMIGVIVVLALYEVLLSGWLQGLVLGREPKSTPPQ